MGYYGPLPAVEAIEIYDKDVIVIRSEVERESVRGGKRGEIMNLSLSSRRRLAFVACNTSIVFRTMVTLTYPSEYPTDGDVVKRHLGIFIKWAKRRWKRIEYLWFLEFQARGAPHIHILLDVTRKTCDIEAVSNKWYEIVDSGDKKHLVAGTRIERIRKPDGAARYAVKYAFKMKQKAVPQGFRNVGRFWGMSRGVNPVKQTSWECDESSLRAMLAGWKWAPGPGREMYSILYGAAEVIRKKLAT